MHYRRVYFGYLSRNRVWDCIRLDWMRLIVRVVSVWVVLHLDSII